MYAILPHLYIFILPSENYSFTIDKYCVLEFFKEHFFKFSTEETLTTCHFSDHRWE